MPRGASLLIAEQGRFLMAARPAVQTDDRTLVELTGIGGWLERDETFSAAVKREAREEIGAEIRLIDLHQTLIIEGPDQGESICMMREIGPVALVFCRVGTPPFDPWALDYRAVVAVAVYAAVLEERPRIVAPEEHPFFVWLHPEQLIALCDSELPLDFLVSDGAEIFGEPRGDRGRTVIRLTDSIPALLTALGPSAYSFLGDIARLTQPPEVV
jgi:8-oxo-dGTP pyrophosphatase MutT (NUDIX family)